MRKFVVMMLGVMLVSCGQAPQANVADNQAAEENEFPKPGDYHIIRDVTVGNTTNRYETDSSVDASSRDQLLVLVSGSMDSPFCDDRQVTIGGGSFSIRQDCNNMAVDTHGTYSPDSIDITYERTVNGAAHTDTATYRLKD